MKKLIIAGLMLASTCVRAEDRLNLPVAAGPATARDPIRAFCVDFNWGPGGPNGFAPPGLWADADPAAHVAWYAALGANVIQTFAVSCNGYAWYKGGTVPAQPGLKHDFLPDVVRLGHAKDMKVMGYFCVGANTRWGAANPDLSYGTPGGVHIPFTDAYLDHLAATIEEALAKSGMDGFMIDWVWNPSDKVRKGVWLPAEMRLFEQLTGRPFPGADNLAPEAKLYYERKAIDRCWARIRAAAKKAKPDCIIWLSCNKVADPTIAGSALLREVDWMMDESGNPDALRSVAPMLGPHTRPLLCVVGWGDRHDARKVVADAANTEFGVYGFSRPGTNSLPLPAERYLAEPPEAFKGNDRNIAVLARVFNGRPLPPPAAAVRGPHRASSEWGPGYEVAKAFDGDETTRWGAAQESRSGWIEVDLGEAREIDRAVVMEIGFHRTEKFAIEARIGEAWKPIVTGTAIAGRRAYDFPPVKARVFRLNIEAANEVPTIEEFAVLPPGAPLPASVEVVAREEAACAARLKWFDEAKYGLFINWGLYAIPAGEWKGRPVEGIGEWIMNRAKIPVKEYELLAGQFNPSKFNADEWARLAVDAGMKYVVYDCKHHDGFAMYRSRVSPYNVHDATPWKRDPFKELQQACAKRGLKLCFYYSQAQDWHHPGGGVAGNKPWDPAQQGDFDQYLRNMALPQVKELLTNYGPIGLIWFDTPVNMNEERIRPFVEAIRTLQPDCLINSRLLLRGGTIKDLTPEAVAKAIEARCDYISRGDNEIPHTVTPGAWETAATINDTWGFKKGDRQWKTPGDICFKLVDIVSKGGNYLLNVGPDAEGFIPQQSQDILREVGAWLRVNGEAVYGAGRTPFGDELGTPLPGPKDKRGQPPFAPKNDWRCTTKPGRLYLHFFRWPGARFELAGVQGKVGTACLLADGRSLRFAQAGDVVTLELPPAAPPGLATVVRLEIQESGGTPARSSGGPQ